MWHELDNERDCACTCDNALLEREGAFDDECDCTCDNALDVERECTCDNVLLDVERDGDGISGNWNHTLEVAIAGYFLLL